MNPEGVRVFPEGDVGAHGENIGVDRHREHNRREDREDLHREVELIGEEGVVGCFEGLDNFLVVFEDVPKADIGADEILKIDFEGAWNEWAFFLKERLDDGSLRFQCPAEIENVSLYNGDFEDHLFFFSVEDAFLDRVEVLGDVVEAREAGTEKHIEEMIQEVRRCFIHKYPAFPLAFFECLEKIHDLKDVASVPGDEVCLGEDDIHFARVGGAIGCVEERNMNRKEKAVFESDRLGLIGGCREFLNGDRMYVEVFLQVQDVFRSRIRHIDPGDRTEGNMFHCVFI